MIRISRDGNSAKLWPVFLVPRPNFSAELFFGALDAQAFLKIILREARVRAESHDLILAQRTLGEITCCALGCVLCVAACAIGLVRLRASPGCFGCFG